MSLYILDRVKYKKAQSEYVIYQMSSDDFYQVIEKDLTRIEIKYGDILAFDQSLPHGYALNSESNTHWSLNCRFKGLHTLTGIKS